MTKPITRSSHARDTIPKNPEVSFDPAPPPGAPNPKVLTVSIGTYEDCYIHSLYAYGNQVGGARLFISPPETKNLGLIEKQVKAYVTGLRAPAQGAPILGPDEKLDTLYVSFHGTPDTFYVGGFENDQSANIGALLPLANYAKHIVFTGCNQAADMFPEDTERSLVQLKFVVLPFLKFGTSVDLNSTYGLMEYGHFTNHPELHKDAGENTWGPISIEVDELGPDNPYAVRAGYGPGGNSYRFVPVDSNGNGIYDAGEYTVHRVYKNGDCVSDLGGENSTGEYELYATKSIEKLYADKRGDDIYEYYDLSSGKVTMPKNQFNLNIPDDYQYNRILNRFDQALAEGLNYDHKKSMEMVLSFVKLKHNDPDTYEDVRAELERLGYNSDGYLALIDATYNKVYVEKAAAMRDAMVHIPKSHGQLLDDPQTPGLQ
jgi:hypothetical protein